MQEKELQIEKKYLKDTINILDLLIADADQELTCSKDEFVDENKNYLNSMAEMDLNTLSEETAITIANLQVSLENKVAWVEKLKQECDIYKKMIASPYFAKIDIIPDDSKKHEKYYIGMHTVADKNNKFIVLDWRSPIASVFYDYQVGKAKILSDNSCMEVLLHNKRQFKIENKELIYYFDTNIAIEDELLKDALGQNSSNVMKNIVQTIQSEQNAIIRSTEGVDLVVNGVAGSGKTSIALHRIAYLLYKLKGKLDSNSILIISHNNAFSSYISQVLPELAERDVNKEILDILCKKNLENIADIEDKYEQIERIINFKDQAELYRIKTSYSFYERLKDYCFGYIANLYKPKSFEIMGVLIPEEKIKRLFFESYAGKDLFTRICWISEALTEDYFYNVKNKSALKRLKISIFEKLYSYLTVKKPVTLYLNFLKQEGLSMGLRGKRIKNEDAYPIWYIKMFLKGSAVNTKIKHLFVDEMQEYSAIQIKILDLLYPCTKTFLGDFAQNIECDGAKNTIDNYENIIGKKINYIELNKSYRSTMQISKFFSFLAPKSKITYIDRLGENVGFLSCDNIVVKIKNLIKRNCQFASIGIITKTIKQAKVLYKSLRQVYNEVSLIADNKDVLKSKICVISAYNSKGLEFDYVIIPNADCENYASDYDNNLLFIGASRAMHKLDLLAEDKFCDIIQDYLKQRGENND